MLQPEDFAQNLPGFALFFCRPELTEIFFTNEQLVGNFVIYKNQNFDGVQKETPKLFD